MKSKWVKKLLAACLAAGLSISLLAGCGGKGGEGDGNEGAKGGKEVTDAQKQTQHSTTKLFVANGASKEQLLPMLIPDRIVRR